MCSRVSSRALSRCEGTDRQRRPPSCPRSILSNYNRICNKPLYRPCTKKLAGQHLHLGKGDVRVNQSGPIAPTSIFAHEQRRPPDASEGAAASGKALGEVALLSPDEALQRLSSTADGLTPDQVEQQLRSVGRNEVAHQTRHTILG